MCQRDHIWVNLKENFTDGSTPKLVSGNRSFFIAEIVVPLEPRSNVYKDLKTIFLRYYHSDQITSTQVTRLRTIPFNPKTDASVQKVVCQIMDPDPGLTRKRPYGCRENPMQTYDKNSIKD